MCNGVKMFHFLLYQELKGWKEISKQKYLHLKCCLEELSCKQTFPLYFIYLKKRIPKYHIHVTVTSDR